MWEKNALIFFYFFIYIISIVLRFFFIIFILRLIQVKRRWQSIFRSHRNMTKTIVVHAIRRFFFSFQITNTLFTVCFFPTLNHLFRNRNGKNKKILCTSSSLLFDYEICNNNTAATCFIRYNYDTIEKSCAEQSHNERGKKNKMNSPIDAIIYI